MGPDDGLALKGTERVEVWPGTEDSLLAEFDKRRGGETDDMSHGIKVGWLGLSYERHCAMPCKLLAQK